MNLPGIRLFRQPILALMGITVMGCIPRHVKAQRPMEWNAAQIKLHLLKIGVLGKVLYIAAHPDDENTQLLAYLANGRLYETAYLSCTRGDGGQNLIGDEQGEEMGLIRTQELLAARRIDGARQFFTRANDFGFSKSAEETLRFWGHERILGDVVWVIRKFQPDVIICRFPEDSRAGHGQHWASAILAHEAFQAAADPHRFPEQLQYVKPWQAKRLLWNTYRFGNVNTTSAEQFHIDDGGFNTLIGESYGEIAADSRSMHKSQGFGVPHSRGEHEEYFIPIAGNPPVHDLMDGVTTGWADLPGGQRIQHLIDSLQLHFRVDSPDLSIPGLITLYQAIAQMPENRWKQQKLQDISELIQQCAGLYMEATTDQPTVAPGQHFRIHAEIINRSHLPVTLMRIAFPGDTLSLHQSLPGNVDQQFLREVVAPDTTPISQPYWLQKPHPIGYYEVEQQQLIGLPENPPAFKLTCVLDIAGQQFSYTLPVRYKYTDPVKGELYEPFVVTPSVTVNMENKVYVFTDTHPVQVRVLVKAFQDSCVGYVRLQLPKTLHVTPEQLPYQLLHRGDEVWLNFQVQATAIPAASRAEQMQAVAYQQGKTFDKGYRLIRYSHIPDITWFPPAEARAVLLSLHIRGTRIGYIMGAGDQVPEALRQCGFQVTLLNEQDVMHGHLNRFDAIVTGIRAYNTVPWLAYAQPILLQYVHDGGTLVVQYNNNFNLVTTELGPYPFTLSRDRVTEEDAPVQFLLPDDPLLHDPNEITAADFEGWIQERGLYFVSRADDHYRKPFSMHDTGDRPLDGSTLVADYGKGKYVYTCLDFFRELPAGVPGAFRLFVNMLATRKPVSDSTNTQHGQHTSR